ncbi:MAG TPA: 23S rRNA (adenine(2503)-C(2))-methyltransferase RlmN [Natronincola sp.]|nr:23S rRNA (adenine(2503)-C(2))-methyltransferase RlmN [Natronincola sp.]
MNSGGNIDLTGLFVSEIAQWLKEHKVAPYRASQIFHWIHQQTVQDFHSMANLPAALIELLKDKFGHPVPLDLVVNKRSIDGTEKFLFRLHDDATIEAVWIPEDHRQTICISTQVGCAMNCSFCATGKGGFSRNLSAGEIVAQALWIENYLKEQGLSISNVVYMGMGEPLANYDQVIKSIRLINDATGLNIGARRITLSTCGLAPQIRALAGEELQINLAISLHAVSGDVRSEIMPINKLYPLNELLGACDFYVEQTGRRLSFEYALIANINDKVEHAKKLVELLKGRLCHVNLIPVNPVGEEKRPSEHNIKEFARILDEANIPVSIRKERGTDIKAACGQLRQSL